MAGGVRMNRFSNTVLNIFLLGFSLLIGIAFLEIASKIVLKTTRLNEKIKYAEDGLKNSSPAYSIGCSDEYLGWGFRPNTSEKCRNSDFDVDYSINSKGFRDRETSVDGLSEKFRIIALGESTVFGEGVDYGRRFTEIIENALDNVEVINMGVWGFGADQSLLQLERDGFQFKPDAVILFVIEDFFERCKLYQRGRAVKPRFVLNDNKDGLVLQDINFIKNKLLDNVYSEALQNGLGDIHKKNVPSFLESSSLFILLHSRKRLLEINEIMANKDRDRWLNFSKQYEEDKKRDIAYNNADFKRIVFLMLKRYKELCDRHSVNFMLVYIGEDKEYFSEWLAVHLMSLGIDYLDLSSDLCEASKKNPLRFSIDPHYNGSTHRLIGEYVSDYLSKKYNLASNKEHIYN
jgi:hypothetical protein